jgi:hypothetical protein
LPLRVSKYRRRSLIAFEEAAGASNGKIERHLSTLDWAIEIISHLDYWGYTAPQWVRFGLRAL